MSNDDLPWLWTELNDLKKQVLDAKKHNKTIEETPGNSVFLSVYLRDSVTFNKWLDTPKEQLFKTKVEIEKYATNMEFAYAGRRINPHLFVRYQQQPGLTLFFSFCC